MDKKKSLNIQLYMMIAGLLSGAIISSLSLSAFSKQTDWFMSAALSYPGLVNMKC